MLRRLVFVGLCAGVLVPGMAMRAAAQALPCTYDRCALRYEEPWIVAGVSGERVGSIGAFSVPDLADRVRGSDSAVVYALRFERAQRTGNALSFVGGAILLGSYIWLLTGDFGSETWSGPVLLSLGGSGIAIAGGLSQRSARRSMARAIWWYNRDLPR